MILEPISHSDRFWTSEEPLFSYHGIAFGLMGSCLAHWIMGPLWEIFQWSAWFSPISTISVEGCELFS